MTLPCEKVSREVFPAVRAIVTKKLLQEYNLTQTAVAKLMGLSQPAISLYYRNSRGIKTKSLENNSQIMILIDNLVQNIKENKKEEKIQECYCQICKYVRKIGFFN